ncbi:hypothetical protein KJ632_02640 [Patescibacteria group bacterium]|nr:hypothetical protein [Patescibacteria group bacterium]
MNASPENKNNQEDVETKTSTLKADPTRLTEKEYNDIKTEKISFKDVLKERNQVKTEAENEINRLKRTSNKDKELISDKEYLDFQKRLEATDSPTITREILEEIKNLPKEKEAQASLDAEKSKELPLDSPKLKIFQHKFNTICDENAHLIGEKELQGFKRWFSEEQKKSPTIKNSEDIIKRLEGKDFGYQDSGGLAPRREEFGKLKKLFQKYEISSPLENAYIKNEGLSERQNFRKGTEKIAELYENDKARMLYSPKAIKSIMQESLKVTNPLELQLIHKKADKISNLESQNMMELDAQTNIGGVTIRKMSRKSKEKYLDYYKDTNLKERDKLVRNWKTLANHEEKLGHDLEKIYKDDPDSLKMALRSFSKLDYMEKEKALKEHTQLAKESVDKKERDKKLTLKAVEADLKEAQKEGTISEKTLNNYLKWFADENNYKKDLASLKEAYAILSDNNPREQYKNLSAYKNRRKSFQKDLKTLNDISGLSEKEIQEKQKNYDDESWTGREKVQKELTKEIQDSKAKRQEQLKAEKEAGITNKEKSEARERSPEMKDLLLHVNDLLAEETPKSIAEAYKTLHLYKSANFDECENDKGFLKLEEEASRLKRTIGINATTIPQTEGQKIEQDTENLLQKQANKDRLQELQIQEISIKGVEQSERRHDKTKESEERAKKESLQRAGSEDEKKLIEDFYQYSKEDTEGTFHLDEDGKGAKTEEIQFNDVAWTKEERSHMKERTREEQDRVFTSKEGVVHVDMTNEKGDQIDAEEARRNHEKEKEELAEQLKEEAVAQSTMREKSTSGTKFSEIAKRTTAKRKATDEIKKSVNERLAA